MTKPWPPSSSSWTGDIHMCRALIIISIILGFFGAILVLVGMKCTKIGGSEVANARVTFAGGMNYLVSGKHFFFSWCSCGYSDCWIPGWSLTVELSCSRVVFHDCILLLWKQNKSGISGSQFQGTKVSNTYQFYVDKMLKKGFRFCIQ